MPEVGPGDQHNRQTDRASVKPTSSGANKACKSAKCVRCASEAREHWFHLPSAAAANEQVADTNENAADENEQVAQMNEQVADENEHAARTSKLPIRARRR